MSTFMDLCTPEDISPPATPPNTYFARPSQRHRSSYIDPSFGDNPTQLATVLDDQQLDYIRKVKTIFQQLTTEQKQFFLYEIINCCDNQQLTFVSDIIAPKLKIDFLKELPIEISLHILSFIEDPRTLGRAASVSTFWNSLLKDETTWKSLCLKHQYRRRNSSISGVALLGPPARRLNFSYREYFKRKYNIEAAWAQGGKVTTCFDSLDSGLVTSLQFDDEMIVVGCDNHKIEVFNTTTGNSIHTLEGHEGGVWALQFKGGEAHDPERLLVSGGCDRDVRVWDLNKGQLKHVLRGHTSTVRCLKMRDKRIAVTGSRDTTLRVWDLQHGTMRHVLLGHQASVRCLDIHDNLVVSGSYDSTARVWDINTGRCLHVLTGHYSQIYAIAFDGSRVITGSLDSNIRVWSAETGQCLATLHGHTSLVGQLQLSASTLVSGGSDGCLRVWDLDNYECVHQISAHDNSVTCLQFDDKRMMSGGNDGRVKLWDVKTGRLIRYFTMPAKTIWRLQFTDTRAVVVMQRRRNNSPEEGRTVMEIHNFDIGDVPEMLANNVIEADEDAEMQNMS
ncbi:hypothetical protein NQZ79_g1078 [Umbelopsis isabellina]|nr:hypothetical protein NQZ79_g1078 [Umbelopsis isabellina]